MVPFIERDFYVDDALKSVNTVAQVFDPLRRMQKMLAALNLQLQKIASNRPEVIDVFPV